MACDKTKCKKNVKQLTLCSIKKWALSLCSKKEKGTLKYKMITVITIRED